MDADTIFSGLECRLGRASVAVPVERVAQIVACEIDPPPPLSRPWLGGLAVLSDELLVVIRLVQPSVLPSGRRAINAVLLTSEGERGVRWALEVTAVRSLIRARILPRRAHDAPQQLPSWILRAATAANELVGWIDVAAMIDTLSTAGGARRGTQ